MAGLCGGGGAASAATWATSWCAAGPRGTEVFGGRGGRDRPRGSRAVRGARAPGSIRTARQARVESAARASLIAQPAVVTASRARATWFLIFTSPAKSAAYSTSTATPSSPGRIAFVHEGGCGERLRVREECQFAPEQPDELGPPAQAAGQVLRAGRLGEERGELGRVLGEIPRAARPPCGARRARIAAPPSADGAAAETSFRGEVGVCTVCLAPSKTGCLESENSQFATGAIRN